MVRVPKGWSDYQAAWIVDDDAVAEAPLEDEYDQVREAMGCHVVDGSVLKSTLKSLERTAAMES
jgi:hypothetical protein